MARPKGYDALTWKDAKAFSGRCARPEDVEAGDAVFALGDTHHGHPIDMGMPATIIWYDEEEEFAAVVIQAEAHESQTGEELEVLGILLPRGRTAVAFMEDVEFVEETDHTWQALLEADLEEGEDEDEDDFDEGDYDPTEDDYVGDDDDDDLDDDEFEDDEFEDDEFDDDEVFDEDDDDEDDGQPDGKK
ncbi:MAG: hypothetical protein RJA87_279 [Pseudomonadota bacterium]|jgi:hypothetical protein